MTTKPKIKKVLFPKDFAENAFGARPAHVEAAILNADGVVVQDAVTGDAIALFTRRFGEFVWIVMAFVRDDVAQVDWAFRAYVDDVPDVDATNPVDTLRRFAEVFAIDADLGPFGKGKFVEHVIAKTNDPVGETKKIIERLRDEDPKRNTLMVNPFRRVADGFEGHWITVIDTSKYVRALHRRTAN